MAKKALPRMARVLREARARSGLSQQDLATAAGVARITIANVELGKHSGIRPSTAFKLAKALSIKPQDLTGDDVSHGPAGLEDSIEGLLQEYEEIKKGTVVEPTAQERQWLRQMLEAWGADLRPSAASVLFLLLARRHGGKT